MESNGKPLPLVERMSQSMLDLPQTAGEQKALANQISQALIAKPRALRAYRSWSAGQRERIDRLEEGYGKEQQDRQWQRFSGEILKRIEENRWENQQREIEQVDRQVILESLPEETPVEVELTGEDRVVMALAARHIEKRYAAAKPPQWKEAMVNLRSFLDAAVQGDQPLKLLGNFYRLSAGLYPEVVGRGKSLAWKSIALSYLDADPADYEVFAAMCEVTIANREIALAIGGKMLEAYAANASAYGDYQSMIGIAVAQLISSGYLRGYPDEIVEVAYKAARNQEEFMAIVEYAEKKKEFDLEGMPITFAGTAPEHVRMLVYQEYPLVKKVRNAIGERSDGFRQAYAMKLLEKMGIRLAGQVMVPFALAGLSGYIFLPEGSRPDTKEGIAQIYSEIARLTAGERERIAGELSDNMADFSILNRPGMPLLMIASERQMPLTALDMQLDYLIPQEKKEKRIELMLKNMEIMRFLTAPPEEVDRPRFTRVPTHGGDLYLTIKDRELPGVFEQAVIRRNPKHGFDFSLSLAAVPEIGINKEMRIMGHIFLDNGRVVFAYKGGDGSAMPAPIEHVIVENALLNLFLRSTCPDIEEVQAEAEAIQQTQSAVAGAHRAISGYVGHIGPTRLGDGSTVYHRGSDTAAEKYRAEGRALFGKIGEQLFDLYDLRRKHDETGDRRDITYYSPKEQLGVTTAKPELRRSPDRLLSDV